MFNISQTFISCKPDTKENWDKLLDKVSKKVTKQLSDEKIRITHNDFAKALVLLGYNRPDEVVSNIVDLKRGKSK